MASQNPSALPAFREPALPVPPAPPGREHHVEPVFLDVSTIEEVIEYIVNSRQNISACHWGSEPLLSFHWQASQVHDLSEQLDARLVEIGQPKIQRFEYDYESKTVFLKIGESRLHYKVQIGLRDYIMNYIAKSVATADPTIRDFLRSIEEPGTALIEYQDKLCKQPDGSFGRAHQYIDSSDGKIRVALIVDLQYPDIKKAWVSLLAADDSSNRWVQHSELFYDDDLDQQPVGQVDLYLSDFLGPTGLPAALCRPSTAELATGVSRPPQIILTYERLKAIFRRARYSHNPTKFTTEVGDEEENPYEEVERRVAEARNEVRNKARTEMERRFAEERNEAHIEMDRWMAEERNKAHIEMDRWMAEERNKTRVEMDRWMAEERTKARVETDWWMAEECTEARIEMERRLAEECTEARIKMERRLAEAHNEARIKMERRLAEAHNEARIEMERRMA
ncbi:hypothetical protein C8A00DRAFT_37700 [Chaetomidium leptoderma]|uniref:Uncharacterized protein n=1 Tax=Chaetomidium leptoderma TaxID=669021 RepID=A0AAN6VDX7_9PEZI|nr:hypothetical protein C8A00DRAFT_37700 [Chaetomidium leptoderma]